MFKAVIFDFDGTLVDSEWAYALTDIKFMETLGGENCSVDHLDLVGHGISSIIEHFIAEIGIVDKSVDELISLNDNLFLDIAHDEIDVFPIMMDLIKVLKERDIPMAVATGTTQVILNKVAQNTGINRYIDRLYSSRVVDHEKPQPDIFLYAAEKLGVKPEECLVFEDSQTGVTAAIRAGMNVVWIDNISNKNRALQDLVYKYCPNGHEDLKDMEILNKVNQA